MRESDKQWTLQCRFMRQQLLMVAGDVSNETLAFEVFRVSGPTFSRWMRGKIRISPRKLSMAANYLSGFEKKKKSFENADFITSFRYLEKIEEGQLRSSQSSEPVLAQEFLDRIKFSSKNNSIHTNEKPLDSHQFHKRSEYGTHAENDRSQLKRDESLMDKAYESHVISLRIRDECRKETYFAGLFDPNVESHNNVDRLIDFKVDLRFERYEGVIAGTIFKCGFEEAIFSIDAINCNIVKRYCLGVHPEWVSLLKSERWHIGGKIDKYGFLIGQSLASEKIVSLKLNRDNFASVVAKATSPRSCFRAISVNEDLNKNTTLEDSLLTVFLAKQLFKNSKLINLTEMVFWIQPDE